MVKQKKSIVLMARVLVLALLIGVFASVPSEQTFAAANKCCISGSARSLLCMIQV